MPRTLAKTLAVISLAFLFGSTIVYISILFFGFTSILHRMLLK